MRTALQIPHAYVGAFSFMFFLGPLVKIDKFIDISDTATALISLSVLGFIIVGLSCWAWATRTYGIKGFIKGFIAVFFGFADSAILYAAYKGINSPNYMGAIILILLFLALHWLVIKKWFLIKPEK